MRGQAEEAQKAFQEMGRLLMVESRASQASLDSLMLQLVDLGSEAVDTRSNAEETRRWMTRRGYTSLRLVTSDYHMRRAAYELRSDLPDARIIEDAVPTRPSLLLLFKEYNFYLVRRAAFWLDM